MPIPFQDIRETRRARADEARAIEALLADAPDEALGPGAFRSAAEFLAFLADNRAVVYVAAPIGRPPLGVVAASMAPPPLGEASEGEDERALCLVPALWVAPSERRRGWGGKLARQAMIWARRRSARAVAFHRPPSGSGDAFARSRGWRESAGSEPRRRWIAEVAA